MRFRVLGLVAALVAAGLTAVAVTQVGRARDQTRIATARELAAAATANVGVDPQRSILLALSSLETTGDDAPLPEAMQALHAAVAADREILTLRDPSTANVAYSPDGRLIATGGTSGGKEQTDVVIWDARTGERLRTLHGHTGDITSVAFSPDSARLVTAAGHGDDRTIVWDVATGVERTVIRGDEPGILVWGASFDPSGRRILIGEQLPNRRGEHTGELRVADATAGRALARVGIDNVDGTPVSTPDGRRIAVPTFDSVFIVDASTFRVVQTVDGGGDALAVSPDGARLATGGDGGVAIWSLAPASREIRHPELRLSVTHVQGLDWSSDGAFLATGSEEAARIWNVDTGQSVLELDGHAGLVALVAFSPDGKRLVTGGGDGTARVWDITPAGNAEVMSALEPNWITSVAYAPDGGTILASGDSGRAWLWDAVSGERLNGYGGAGRDSALGPDANNVLLLGDRFTLLDTWSGLERQSFDVPGSDVPGTALNSVAIDAGGTVIAAATGRGHVDVWDAHTAALLQSGLGDPAGPLDAMNGVALSPDGGHVAAISGLATAYVWDVASGRELARFQASSGQGKAIAFSPDGRLVATAGGDGAAVRTTSGEPIATMVGTGRLEDVAFSHDGTLVATAGVDHTARIWDAASGRELLSLPGNGDVVAGVAFSPDGTRLATVGNDGTLRVYALSAGELVRIARARLTRGFTDQECVQYLHLPSCSDGPGRASPSGAPILEPLPRPAGPEGSFRVRISPRDLVPPLTAADYAYSGGDYTWYLQGGAWAFHQSATNVIDDWSGTYRISGRISGRASGERLVFTVAVGQPECVGERFAAEIAARAASSLTFAHAMQLTTPQGCGPRAWAAGWLRTVFEQYPWQRVA